MEHRAGLRSRRDGRKLLLNCGALLSLSRRNRGIELNYIRARRCARFKLVEFTAVSRTNEQPHNKQDKKRERKPESYPKQNFLPQSPTCEQIASFHVYLHGAIQNYAASFHTNESNVYAHGVKVVYVRHGSYGDCAVRTCNGGVVGCVAVLFL